MGIGTIPAPVFDAVAIAVLQTRIVRQIAEAYDVPFERIPAWTVTSITGVLTVPGGLVSSMTKSIPVIGPWLGGTTATLVAGASTYAIGRVFAQHFGGGGTFLTLDPVKAKQAYSAGLDKGKGKAADIAAQAAGRFGFGAKPTVWQHRAHLRADGWPIQLGTRRALWRTSCQVPPSGTWTFVT